MQIFWNLNKGAVSLQVDEYAFRFFFPVSHLQRRTERGLGNSRRQHRGLWTCSVGFFFIFFIFKLIQFLFQTRTKLGRNCTSTKSTLRVVLITLRLPVTRLTSKHRSRKRAGRHVSTRASCFHHRRREPELIKTCVYSRVICPGNECRL